MSKSETSLAERIRNAAAFLRQYMKKGDVVIISALLGVSLLLGVFALLPSQADGRAYAVIRRDGAEITRLPLDTDTSYIISDADAHNTIVISNGTARMSHADCPDGLCVRTGVISRSGQTIVCLPNRVSVTIENDDDRNGVDAVVY